MFKCQICGRITNSGEEQHKKIVEKREKTYNYVDSKGIEKTKKGWEIVKEINICKKCEEKEREEQ